MLSPTLSHLLWRPTGVLALAASMCLASYAHAAPVAFNGNYSQNFDTLATSGTSNAWLQGSTLEGWYLYTGASADISTYQAGNGSTNAGAFYSFGATGSPERALGGTASGGAYFGSPLTGAPAGYIALAAVNSTGTAVDSLSINFNGEQWRNGGNASAQSMLMQYGIRAC